jgi:hypothetical protein
VDLRPIPTKREGDGSLFESKILKKSPKPRNEVKERLITKIMSRNYEEKSLQEIMRRNYQLAYIITRKMWEL